MIGLILYNFILELASFPSFNEYSLVTKNCSFKLHNAKTYIQLITVNYNYMPYNWQGNFNGKKLKDIDTTLLQFPWRFICYLHLAFSTCLLDRTSKSSRSKNVDVINDGNMATQVKTTANFVDNFILVTIIKHFQSKFKSNCFVTKN